MKQSQSERLSRILMQDKSSNPQKVLPSLKADLRDVIRQYGELIDDVKVEIQETEYGYTVIFLSKILRFKTYGNII